MTPRQAAEYAGVSAKTIYRWRRDGLPYFQIGRVVRIRDIALREWLREHTIAGED